MHGSGAARGRQVEPDMESQRRPGEDLYGGALRNSTNGGGGPDGACSDACRMGRQRLNRGHWYLGRRTGDQVNRTVSRQVAGSSSQFC